jgi:hypothetical protein
MEDTNQFILSDNKLLATHKVTGRKFKAVSTGCQKHCNGCEFFCIELGEQACWELPCNEKDWKDGQSRIWKEIFK